MTKHGWKWERLAALLALVILLAALGAAMLDGADHAKAASWNERAVAYSPDGWSWGDDPQ